jgi:BadF/BadG/BcrA/BcrD ATPase family protein
MAPMTRKWTVGVDAGGTWLRVLAADGRGRRRVMRKPASHDLPAALRGVWRRWRLGRADVSHLVVATRGVWTASERRAAAVRLRGLARRVTVLSDAEAGHLGALGGRSGLLVLAGTGSIVLGRGARGRWVRAGGLGPLFGDGGSAFALGRDWLAAAHPSRARRLAQAPRAAALIAALAPRVLKLARRGRGPARVAVTRGASALALFMRAAARDAGLRPPIRVSWAGRLLEDRAYRSRVWRAARGLGLRIAPVEPLESALEAAARLARVRDGRRRPAVRVERRPAADARRGLSRSRRGALIGGLPASATRSTLRDR